MVYAPLLRRLVVMMGLGIYLTLGIYTELSFSHSLPIPDGVFQDFKFYERALQDALVGQDPYAERSIGVAYLYPPPALLVVEIFHTVRPFLLRVAVYSVVNFFLLGILIYGIARRYGYSVNAIWYWFVLCFGFAPFYELLHIGQINVITLFGIFLLFLHASAFPLLAGVGLSLAVATKVTPLLFVWYLAVARRWRALLYTGIALGVLLLISGLRYGFSPMLTYPDVFLGLLREFPLGINSQSLVAKIAVAETPALPRLLTLTPSPLQGVAETFFWFATAHVETIHRGLTLYILALIGVSGLLTHLDRSAHEPLFIITALGMTLSSNIMWYHHYVFLLLPLLVWMGWSRLKPSVVLWCFVGLLIVQFDRRLPPYGLLIHLFGHLSMWLLLAGQIRALYRRRSQTPALAQV